MNYYIVTIRSLNKYNEIEWTERFKSTKSMRGARTMATKWINKNLFKNDYCEIAKEKKQFFEWWTIK